MPTLHNKKFSSADFEQNKFDHSLKRFANFRAKYFCSKSAEMKILLCNVGMGKTNFMKLYFFIYVSKIGAYESNSP